MLITRRLDSRSTLSVQSEREAFRRLWVPKDYLATFYREVEPDERKTIEFFVNAVKHFRPEDDSPVLFFGVGPTMHHVFLAAPHASQILLTDFLISNLKEVGSWLEAAPGCHDWKLFVRYTLECEGHASPTDADIQRRERLTRSKVRQLLQADASYDDPLGTGGRAAYALVVSPYCADSATADKDVWRSYMNNIGSLVKPGGALVTAALKECTAYQVGQRTFPSANVNEDDLRRVLAEQFIRESITIEARTVVGHGYSGILLAHAVKAGGQHQASMD